RRGRPARAGSGRRRRSRRRRRGVSSSASRVSGVEEPAAVDEPEREPGTVPLAVVDDEGGVTPGDLRGADLRAAEMLLVQPHREELRPRARLEDAGEPLAGAELLPTLVGEADRLEDRVGGGRTVPARDRGQL